MRKVLYGLNVSLDGFYEDINGKIDFTVPDDEVFLHFIELEKEVEVHLYGRKLYETMCYWKSADRRSRWFWNMSARCASSVSRAFMATGPIRRS